jgi:protein involved in polysaccharide export with SLBB domain
MLLYMCGSVAAAGPGSAAAGLIDFQKMFAAQDVPLAGIDLAGATDKSQLSRSYIDNSIDEDSYYIGMGDVFAIAILEIPTVLYTALINQNGDAYISQFGVIKLGKITLREAKKRILEFVKRQFKSNYTFFIALRDGKKACVVVNGCVTNPGTAIYEGVMRITDCMLKANKMTVFSLGEVDLRDVTVDRVDTTLHLDILKYILTNDLSQNPYVYPGDRIYVSPVVRKIYLNGEIAKPSVGFFSIKPNETLADILKLVQLTDAADSNHIIVQQGATDAVLKNVVTSFSNAETITLKNMDMITFAPKVDYPTTIMVSVSGAVARPGTYPCSEKNTTAEAIIKLAGGYLERADSNRVSILRDRQIVSLQTDYKPDKLKLDNSALANQGSVRPELNASMTRLINFRDFTVVPYSKNNPIIVENGDQIFIPSIESFVYVSGCVNKPGAYQYVEGKQRNYYILLAGGFSLKSDRENTYIITHIKNVIQMRDGKRILPGDIIVIPDSQNNKTLTTVLLPLLQIISTAVTVVIAIVTLRGA